MTGDEWDDTPADPSVVEYERGGLAVVALYTIAVLVGVFLAALAVAAVSAWAVSIPPPTKPVKPPTTRIVTAIVGSSLQREDAASRTHYGFHDAQCRAIVAGRSWVCTIRARSLPGHLVLLDGVTWKAHVGFHFGGAVEL